MHLADPLRTRKEKSYTHRLLPRLSLVPDVHPAPHGLEIGTIIRLTGLFVPVLLGVLLVDTLDLGFHGVQEVADLSKVRITVLQSVEVGKLTGLGNHRPPLISNQQRCPPSDVATIAVCGFALNSGYGTASSTAI